MPAGTVSFSVSILTINCRAILAHCLKSWRLLTSDLHVKVLGNKDRCADKDTNDPGKAVVYHHSTYGFNALCLPLERVGLVNGRRSNWQDTDHNNRDYCVQVCIQYRNADNEADRAQCRGDQASVST